ncbi:MAG: GNAT family N-acetyltransferase [Propionibacteriaceae bacterium]
MKFFRNSKSVAATAGATARIRRATADDPAVAQVFAALQFPPGSQRDEYAASLIGTFDTDHELWLIDGIDGSAIGILEVSLAAKTLHIWGGVDTVMRRFGVGEQLLQHAIERAKVHGATQIASYAECPDGYAFLLDHGFIATTSADDPVSAAQPQPRIDAVLTLSDL